jgi:alpha-L-fucosidase
VQGNRSYNDHLRRFGHPSVFGYKDVIQLWKAERFDAPRLVDLYQKAGARFIVSIAAHHDNFDLWDSRYHAWNAVNYGPKQDIVGAWAAAAKARGLPFGLSEHFNRTYSWFNTSHWSDKTGPLAGVPYDGNDPRYRDLYWEPHEDSRVSYPAKPPEVVGRDWFWRMRDLIDRYQPDFLYSDGGIPFGQVGRDLLASFYNANAARNGGVSQAVYTIKDYPGHGEFLRGAAIHSLERGHMAGIQAEPWQCEQSVGPWFWQPGIDWATQSKRLLRDFVDIVSKNGTLLLNIPQRADGTLDPGGEQMLADWAAWMADCGPGIFGTRPWKVFGEGPVADAADKPKEKGAKPLPWTTADVRFTRSQDGATVYVFVMGVPTGDLRIRALGTQAGLWEGDIGRVERLGSSAPLTWTRTPEALVITVPPGLPERPVTGFAIRR